MVGRSGSRERAAFLALVGSPRELANSRTPALSGEPDLREQCPRTIAVRAQKNAAAAFSVARRSIGFTGFIAGDVAVVNQQRTGRAMSPHTTSLALEFEFNVLNLNLIAPPRATPII